MYTSIHSHSEFLSRRVSEHPKVFNHVHQLPSDPIQCQVMSLAWPLIGWGKELRALIQVYNESEHVFISYSYANTEIMEYFQSSFMIITAVCQAQTGETERVVVERGPKA